MTTLCFNSIERDQWSSFGCSPEEQKVKDVRNQILHYGVDQKYLFRLEDVTKKMNTPKVVRCLEEVAKLVSIQFRQKFKNLTRWYEEISKREAVQKGYDLLNQGEKIPQV